MFALLNCGGQKAPKKKRQVQETREKIETKTDRKLRFTNDQLYEFTQRFESQATLGRMSLKQYRDSLGLIGMQSLSFLADRMFQVMDTDKNGWISLEEYLTYIDTMMYGEEKEKLYQSFQLLDQRQNGRISYDDFSKIVHSFAKMWSAAIGSPSKFPEAPNFVLAPIKTEYVRSMYKEMTCGKDFLDFDE